MSEFAFTRFITNGLLTEEERKNKDEIIRLTEDVLHARGLECDASIAKVSAEQLKDILEKVRVLRRKRIKKSEGATVEDEEEKEEHQSIQSYIR